MPTYDYRCPACGTLYEVIMKMEDKTPVRCEVCGNDCNKILLPSPIHFHGTGFHGTDYGYKRGVPTDE